MKKPRLQPSADRVRKPDLEKEGFSIPAARILEPGVVEELIRDRQEREIDQWDEVWEGVYVVPPLANNPHQDLGTGICTVLYQVITLEGRGRVHGGANVSDRRAGWKKNYRCPDGVVVLNESEAVDCGTHWFGGPDFLLETESPGDESFAKIPFYGKIKVKELLIIHRDNREMHLFRHNGHELVPVEPATSRGASGWSARSCRSPSAARR